MSRTTTLLLAAAFAASAPAVAQTPTPGELIKNYSTDLSMPDTPGLSIVGLSSENILRPTTPRKLGMAILQGRNENGTAKQGFALDFAPMKVFAPGMTKQEYAGSPYVGRPLWNSQISLGVGQPLSDADKSTRIGLGLSSVLWRNESSDPLMDPKHAACLDAALKADLPGEMPDLDAEPAKEEAANKQIKKCRADLEKRTWNASALMVGFATSRVSGRDPSVLPDASPKGYWVSFNYGFENLPSLQRALQFTASYRRLRQEIVTDPADKTKFLSQSSNLYGMKLYGRMEVANLYIEASRKRSTIDGLDTERADLFVFGAEKKIAENVWLTLAMGSKRGGTTSNPTYVSTGLKFGYEDAPSIKP